MSWDVIFMRAGEHFKSVEDFPKGYYPPVLGNRNEIISKLEEILPGWNFTDNLGLYQGKDHSITLTLISKDKNDEINLLSAGVRGDDKAIRILAVIWKYFHCAAFDFGTGERIDTSEEPGRGFALWKGYRDQITKNSEDL